MLLYRANSHQLPFAHSQDLERMMQSAPLPPGVDAETARKRMEAPIDYPLINVYITMENHNF